MMDFESAMKKTMETVNKMQDGEHKKKVTEILNKLPKSGPNWYYENSAVGPSIPLDKANESFFYEYFLKEAKDKFGDNMEEVNRYVRTSMENYRWNDAFTYRVVDGDKEFAVTITKHGSISINSVISDREPKDTAHIYQQQHTLQINPDRNQYDIRESTRICQKDEKGNDIIKDTDEWQVIKNNTIDTVHSKNTTTVNGKVSEQTESNVSKPKGSDQVKIDVSVNGKKEHETVTVNRDITLEDARRVHNNAINALGNEPKPEKTSKKTAAML